MTILLYNWVLHNDRRFSGGGVQVYQANLIRHLLDRGHRVIEVASGTRHRLFGRRPYMRKKKCGGLLQLTVWNSPVLAPAHAAFDNPHSLESRAFEDFLLDEIRRLPSIDLFHFNNLEGLPVSFLERLVYTFPGCRIKYTFHNYYPLCPQVNFWHHEESRCEDFNHGLKCVSCIDRSSAPIRYTLNLERLLSDNLVRKIIKKAFEFFSRHQLIRNNKRAVQDSSYFENRRLKMVEILNSNVDQMNCVSRRVGEIVQFYGIVSGRIHIDDIGIDFSDSVRAETPIGGKITFGYFGYFRRDKGFHWLLDRLEDLDPNHYGSKLSLVFSSRIGDSHILARINALKEYYDIVVYPGFTHAELAEQLAMVDFGIIPVLWEDCSPQIAKEFVYHGIPILTSHLGGAKELVGNEDYVFNTDEPESLKSCIDRAIDNPRFSQDFWRTCRKVRPFSEYIDEYIGKAQAPGSVE